MKRLSKRTSIILTVVTLVAGSIVYFAFFNQGNSIININDSPAKTRPVPLYIEPETVSIMSYGFEPRTVTVKQGQAVAWTNKDSKTHQIASDQPITEDGLTGFAGQGALLRTDTYLHTFFTKGTYTYYDIANPTTYKGIVIVE